MAEEKWKNRWYTPKGATSLSCGTFIPKDTEYFDCNRYPSKECAEECAKHELAKYPHQRYLGAFPA